MRKASLTIALTVLTLGAVLLLAFVPTAPVLVALTATALFMGGTGHPLSIPQDTTEYITQYVDSAYGHYVAPSGLCTGGDPGCAHVAVYTPEEFPLDTGLFDMPFDESVSIGLANLDTCVRGTACTVTKPPFTTTGSASLTDSGLGENRPPLGGDCLNLTDRRDRRAHRRRRAATSPSAPDPGCVRACTPVRLARRSRLDGREASSAR